MLAIVVACPECHGTSEAFQRKRLAKRRSEATKQLWGDEFWSDVEILTPPYLFSEQAGSVHHRSDFEETVDGIERVEQAVLGKASVSERLLRGEQRQRHG